MLDSNLRSFYQGRRCCITGGAGFIGSHLVDALVACDAEVRIIDDLSFGHRENVAHHADAITFVEGSILDPGALAKATDGVDVIFHQAALASVPRSVEEPLPYADVNTNGTVAILDAAVRTGARRVVSASSSSAYGDQPESPKVETMTPTPRSPYAASKLAAESFLESFTHVYDVSAVSMRYFNIFGPRQRPGSAYAAVIPRFIDAWMNNTRPTVYGDGTQTRDFTYIDNVVQANLKAGATDDPGHGEAYNIACGKSVSVLQLADQIAALLGIEPDLDFQPPRAGDVMHSLADINAAKNDFGYDPDVTLEEGLIKTVQWFKSRAGDPPAAC